MPSCRGKPPKAGLTAKRCVILSGGAPKAGLTAKRCTLLESKMTGSKRPGGSSSQPAKRHRHLPFDGSTSCRSQKAEGECAVEVDTDIWWTEDTLASTVQVILPEHQQLQHYHSTLSGFNISCKLSFKETLNTPSVIPRTYKIAGVIKHIK